jgi:hypothetical protein
MPLARPRANRRCVITASQHIKACEVWFDNELATTSGGILPAPLVKWIGTTFGSLGLSAPTIMMSPPNYAGTCESYKSADSDQCSAIKTSELCDEQDACKWDLSFSDILEAATCGITLSANLQWKAMELAGLPSTFPVVIKMSESLAKCNGKTTGRKVRANVDDLLYPTNTTGVAASNVTETFLGTFIDGRRTRRATSSLPPMVFAVELSTVESAFNMMFGDNPPSFLYGAWVFGRRPMFNNMPV